MRRRYIENTQSFLAIKPDSEEFYTFSANEDHTYVSAMTFMSGLYPHGL